MKKKQDMTNENNRNGNGKRGTQDKRKNMVEHEEKNNTRDMDKGIE